MLKKAFLTNSSGIMCSRIFGFLRDLSMAHILGAGIYSDIFFVAFKFPNLFRRIFCEGAFSQSFLPNFIASSKKGAFVVLTLGAFSIILLCLSLFVMAFSGGVTRILALGFSQNLIEIAKPIVAIHFWYLLLVFWVTFFSALLQYKQHFWVSAYNTALLNIAMILALFLAQGKDELEIVYFVSYGVLLGGVAQVGLHFYPLWKLGFWRLFVCGVLEIKKAFFSGGNSPLGMQCGKILDFLECTDAKSANIPTNPKNLHSHTANTRIVEKKAVIASEQSERGNLNGTASDLQNTQLAMQRDCHAQQVALAMTEKTRECNADFDKSVSNDKKNSHTSAQARSISNKANCHTEALAEVSQRNGSLESMDSISNQDRDISGLSPQYDKDIDCNAEKSDFLKKPHIDCFDKNLESRKTRQSRSFFSNDSKQQKSLASKIKSELKSFFCQFLPAMLGSSTAQIASFIDTILASFLASGSISYLYYANRIFQLPLAIFAIAISTALFPMVAKSIKAKQESQVLQAMKKSFWFLCFMLLACAIGGIMLDKQIIWLLYERGKFVRSDTIECALVFCGYMIGLVPFGLARIFSLYLYATMKQALAAKISAISLGFGVVFSLIFMQFLGAFGLALAGSLSGFVLFGFTIKAFGFAKFWGIIADFKLSALLIGFIGLEVGILWILLEFVQIP